MKRILQIFILIPLLAFTLNSNEAQAQRPMHEIHSMLIFNFIKYVEWPDNSKTGDFVIAVYGDDGVYDQLSKFYASKPIKGQNVKVINVNGVGEISNAHIVYLADNKSGDFDEVISKVSGKPTMVITDKNGLGEKGSNINFKTVGGKLKFELNQAAFDNNKLKVSSQLVSMAIVI